MWDGKGERGRKRGLELLSSRKSVNRLTGSGSFENCSVYGLSLISLG